MPDNNHVKDVCQCQRSSAPVIAEVFIITVADSSVASGTLGLLDRPHHPRGEGRTHEGRLPPARSLVLRKTVVDDGVGDGLVGAHPVPHLAPPLPLMLGLELDPRALDPEPEELCQPMRGLSG